MGVWREEGGLCQGQERVQNLGDEFLSFWLSGSYCIVTSLQYSQRLQRLHSTTTSPSLSALTFCQLFDITVGLQLFYHTHSRLLFFVYSASGVGESMICFCFFMTIMIEGKEEKKG